MDSKEIEQRVNALARDRLANRPGAFRQFQNIWNTMEGITLRARVSCAPLGLAIAADFGHTEPLDDFLVGLIDEWAGKQPLAKRIAPLPQRALATATTPAQETKDRRARRYQLCVDAGHEMPTNDYANLPAGIGKLAKLEGITRQAFSEDVKAHIRTLNGRQPASSGRRLPADM